MVTTVVFEIWIYNNSVDFNLLDHIVAYCTTRQTTKDSYIYKVIIYIFILRRRRLCVVGIQSNSTYLSSVAGSLFVKWYDGRKTHTRSWDVCLSDQQVSPFTWETNGPLPSVKNNRPYIVFSSPMRIYEYPLRPRIFRFWLVIGTYILQVFFSGYLLILSANGFICHSIMLEERIS